MTNDGQHPADAGNDEVPRLPRGRGLKLSRPELVRIAMLAIVLVFLLMTQRRCADAVSGFVTNFDGQGSASPQTGPGAKPSAGAASAPGAEPAAAAPATGSSNPALDGYEPLRPGMTEAEVKAAIERARAKAAGKSAP